MNLRRPVMPLVASASLPVQRVCLEREWSMTVPQRAGGRAPCTDAPASRRRSESQRERGAQGKIKGRGTWARRNPCLHGGKGGTHQEWQRAALGARPAMALRLARAAFAALRCDWLDSAP